MRAKLRDVACVWDRSEHAGMTDLVRWRGAFFLVFRDGETHIGGRDGVVFVLRSQDGQEWERVAVLKREGRDLRDPKLSVAPDGRLMMSMAADLIEGRRAVHRLCHVSFSQDGNSWTPLVPMLLDGGADGEWLWRVSWHEGTAWSLAYSQPPDRENLRLRLLNSRDGRSWRHVIDLDVPDWPNESMASVLPDGRMLALIRREKGDQKGWVGRADPPYTDWSYIPTACRFGGPHFLRLPDGRLIAAGRGLETGEEKTHLAALTEDSYAPLLTLPSGGDTSYPGLVWHEDLLWVSYYSSHDGSSRIYMARAEIS